MKFENYNFKILKARREIELPPVTTNQNALVISTVKHTNTVNLVKKTHDKDIEQKATKVV